MRGSDSVFEGPRVESDVVISGDSHNSRKKTDSSLNSPVGLHGLEVILKP